MSGVESALNVEHSIGVPLHSDLQPVDIQDQDQDHVNPFPQPSRDISDLFNPPKNLAVMRQRLFEARDKIELRVEEFELYWPYIDNVWVRQHRAGTDKSGRNTTDYYACRLQRPTYTPKDVDKPRPEGKPTRKKQIREGGTCQMRVKTIRYNGGYSGITIMQVGDQTQHSHDLDHMDKIKRTTVLMDIARSEVMKGYMPASVFTVMSKYADRLDESGGRYLSRNDIRNASQAWRQVYREPLRVHEGYKYDHGNGIVVMNDQDNSIDPTSSSAFIPPPNSLRYPEEFQGFLEPYLPPTDLVANENGFPHVTLTYATSMDSCLSIAPGLRTSISGPLSKAMTHYLRSRHDSILIGVGTATADDPALNCRLEGVGGYGGVGWEGQPRPVIIDPSARWLLTPQSKVLSTVQEGKGRGPWVIVAPGSSMDPSRLEMLKYYGGKYLGLTDFDKRWRLRWEAILKALAAEGIKSVMIEGGGMVINDLLLPEHAQFISSVIITTAPKYLGRGGVMVSPQMRHDGSGKPQAVAEFKNVSWNPLGEDIIMCGKIGQIEEGPPPLFPI